MCVNLANEDNQFLYFTANVPWFFFCDNRRKRKVEHMVAEPVATVKSGNTSTIASKETGGNEKAPGFELVFGLVSLLCIFLKSRER